MAVPNSLQSLVEDGVIDSVESQLMSGKEASVYVVSYRGELVAAKVYKAREQRTFKATSSYTEGRNQTRNTRDKRAMGKRTSYGRELIEESWRDMEYSALFGAMQGGVRVPKPIMLYEDVLLMELLVDEEGAPAPRLADFDIAPESAEALHHDLFRQVRLLLSIGKVHGDLSAFNILMTHAGPTLIDLPQVVDAAQNNQARDILRRDLQNITEHLARFDARLLRFRHCGDALWAHFQRGTLDQATHPQEGGLENRGGGGRRAALAESGRMGREGSARGAGPG
nr:serine protein kinase RIO [Myxococcota bacterium]